MRLAKEDEVLRPVIYGLIAFLCALCGFGLVVIAPHVGLPLMQLVGALLVLAGVSGGLINLIWGLIRVLRHK